MYAVFRSRQFWGVLGYCLLLVVIVAGGALLGHQARSSKLKAIETSPAALRAAVQEVYLGAESLRVLDGKLTGSTASAVLQQKSLQDAIAKAQETLKSNRSHLSSEQIANLETSLQTQKHLLDEYSAKFSVVIKPLTYNPLLDLGLDINEHEQIVKQRAQQAYENLDKFAQTRTFTISPNNSLINQQFALSDGSFQAISKVALCFRQITSLVKEQIPEATKRCDDNYSFVRQSLIAQLSETYENDVARSSLASLQELL